MNCYYEDIIEVDDNYDTLMLTLNLKEKYSDFEAKLIDGS